MINPLFFDSGILFACNAVSIIPSSLFAGRESLLCTWFSSVEILDKLQRITLGFFFFTSFAQSNVVSDNVMMAKSGIRISCFYFSTFFSYFRVFASLHTAVNSFVFTLCMGAFVSKHFFPACTRVLNKFTRELNCFENLFAFIVNDSSLQDFLTKETTKTLNIIAVFQRSLAKQDKNLTAVTFNVTTVICLCP